MFYYLSKTFWIAAQPTAIVFLLLLAGIVWLFIGKRKAGLISVSLGTLSYFSILYLSIGQLLIAPLENRFPANPELPENIDGIIVLAGPIDRHLTQARNQLSIRDGAERYLEFSKLVGRNRNAKALISGGNPSANSRLPTQANFALRLLEPLGLSRENVMLETRSRNTAENIQLSYEKLNPTADSKWVIVTSAYHMPRAMAVARNFKWKVIPYPVDFRTEGPGGRFFGALDGGEAFTLVNLAVKEWIGLVIYYITGRSATIWQ